VQIRHRRAGGLEPVPVVPVCGQAAGVDVHAVAAAGPCHRRPRGDAEGELVRAHDRRVGDPFAEQAEQDEQDEQDGSAGHPGAEDGATRGGGGH